MGRPKIYFIRPETGWNALDKWRYGDPGALGNFRRRGYEVVTKDGCTVEEFRAIVSRSDTCGIIIAAHGDTYGVGIDPSTPKEKRIMEHTGIPKILRPEQITGSSMPGERGPGAVSPNLLFAVFLGCHLSEQTLQSYARQLGISRSKIYAANPSNEPWLTWLSFEFRRNTEYVTFGQLNDVIAAAYRGILNHPTSALRSTVMPGLSIRPQPMKAPVPAPRFTAPGSGPAAQLLFQRRHDASQQQSAQEAARRARENAQRFADQAARRARDGVQRQAREDAERQRRLQETLRRTSEETARRRAQQEAERRRAQEAAQQREREAAARRQLALAQARIRQPPTSTIRPRVWEPPLVKHEIIWGQPIMPGDPHRFVPESRTVFWRRW
jgi:hypothetical protein